MRRRRVRVAVGRGGVVYLVVSALILAAALYTQANLLFWSFGLMVGGLAVSLLFSFWLLAGVTVQRVPPAHAVAGELVVLRYQVTSRSWLPMFGLLLHETWGRRRGWLGWLGRAPWKKAGPIADRPPRLLARPFGWVLHLAPHTTLQAEAPCWPRRRGYLAFERVVVSSSFPFGVINKEVEFEQASRVLVYPRLLRVNRRLLYQLSQLDPTGRKHQEKGGGHEEFFGLREYRYGDNPRTIDWKHTARSGVLIARELTQPSPPRLMVLLDLTRPDEHPEPGAGHGNGRAGRGGQGAARATGMRAKLLGKGRRPVTPRSDDDAVEQAITLAASIICDAHFHGYQVGLAIAGVEAATFPVHHSLPHRTRILEALATLDTTRRRAAPPPLPSPPGVIIRPGAAGSARGPGGARAGEAIVIGTDQMKHYVSGDAAGEAVLARRPPAVSRRAELAGRYGAER